MDKELNPDEPTPETPKAPVEKPVDLSALQGFDFGTSWSESKTSRGSNRSDNRDFNRGDRRSSGKPADRKDRRPFKPGNFRKSDDRRPKEGPGGEERRYGDQGRKPFGRPEIPKTVAEVSFYPDDNRFKALCKALRVSAITYELFEIAKTMLEKEDRFYMVIRPVDEKPVADDSSEKSFYVVESDSLPFLNKDAAMQHAMTDCLDHYFTTETKEVEPPSGSFTAIQKCGVTGELLGPPNYHRLKKIMADHHASRLSHMPYAKFESRIETVKEEEVIAEWLEKMKTQTTYTLKPEFGEVREFEDGETARAFVRANLSDKLVKEVKSARVEGTQLAQIKDASLKAYLDYAWERQKRFPLDSANLLRGRLRRQKFALYKKGTKGVSYVCAVKRRFREPHEALSEPVSKLIDFVEKHPKIPAKQLPQQYLGFSTFAPEGEPQPEITDEQKAAFKAFTLDFQWLLKEGYIAEYSDGTVFAHPPSVVTNVPVKTKTPERTAKSDIPATPASTPEAVGTEMKVEEPIAEAVVSAVSEVTPENSEDLTTIPEGAADPAPEETGKADESEGNEPPVEKSLNSESAKVTADEPLVSLDDEPMTPEEVAPVIQEISAVEVEGIAEDSVKEGPDSEMEVVVDSQPKEMTEDSEVPEEETSGSSEKTEAEKEDDDSEDITKT